MESDCIDIYRSILNTILLIQSTDVNLDLHITNVNTKLFLHPLRRSYIAISRNIFRITLELAKEQTKHETHLINLSCYIGSQKAQVKNTRSRAQRISLLAISWTTNVFSYIYSHIRMSNEILLHLIETIFNTSLRIQMLVWHPPKLS